jgi:predicted patatin/cPLA2 family phospholipase
LAGFGLQLLTGSAEVKMVGGINYAAVVFAGGGNRCWWQAGFWETVAEEVDLKPRVVAGVSAGASMAAMVLSHATDRIINYFKQTTRDNQRNFYWNNLFTSRPVCPHVGIFRRGIEEVMDQDAPRRLQQGPKLRVLLARPPRWSGAWAGTLLGFLCYTFEKHLAEPLHPQLPFKLGFRPEVVTLNDCQSARELADLLLMTSATPPLVPIMYYRGGPVLDGGLVDNVGVVALRPEERPALVLLSRRYSAQKLQGHRDITYIQPSRAVPVGKWDYTDPDGLQAAFDLGRRDGELFLREGPQALQR